MKALHKAALYSQELNSAPSGTQTQVLVIQSQECLHFSQSEASLWRNENNNFLDIYYLELCYISECYVSVSYALGSH